MAWMRKANREWLAEHATYKDEGEIKWRCKTTGEPIMIQETGRTIWDDDGPGPCASSQGVQLVLEAYCPKCMKIPKVRTGEPIQESDLITV